MNNISDHLDDTLGLLYPNTEHIKDVPDSTLNLVVNFYIQTSGPGRGAYMPPLIFLL